MKARIVQIKHACGHARDFAISPEGEAAGLHTALAMEPCNPCMTRDLEKLKRRESGKMTIEDVREAIETEPWFQKSYRTEWTHARGESLLNGGTPIKDVIVHAGPHWIAFCQRPGIVYFGLTGGPIGAREMQHRIFISLLTLRFHDPADGWAAVQALTEWGWGT